MTAEPLTEENRVTVADFGKAAAVALLCGALAAASAFAAGVPFALPALCFAINWIAFVPAARLRSERFYDMTGSVTFLAVVATALALAEGPLSVSRVVPAVLVALWTLRLGSFLVARIRRAGKDGRFDAMKAKPARFFIAWTVQALWVHLTSIAAVLCITHGAREGAPRPFELVGWGVWCAGFVVEIVADRQKAAHGVRAPGTFINSGLWAFSRHPNYFGEIVLWLGLFVAGIATYDSAPQWIAAAASPVFVAVLLVFVSGIPLLEERADRRYGADPAYQDYKARVSILVPLPRARSSR